MLKKIVFCFCLAGISPVYLIGQGSTEIYNTFDNVVGFENTVLYNGIESLDLQKTINEKNKFLFTTTNYSIGTIVYDGQYFPAVRLKFNVVDDRLLAQIPVNGRYSSFQLITQKIENFSLNGHHFQKLDDPDNNISFKGFYEQIFSGDEVKVFKKYQKSEKKKLDKSYIYYEYSPDDPEYYLKYKGEYYAVNSKSEVIEVFPSLKKEIRQTYRSEKDLRKSNSDAFMILLFNQIVNLQN